MKGLSEILKKDMEFEKLVSALDAEPRRTSGSPGT